MLHPVLLPGEDELVRTLVMLLEHLAQHSLGCLVLFREAQFANDQTCSRAVDNQSEQDYACSEEHDLLLDARIDERVELHHQGEAESDSTP